SISANHRAAADRNRSIPFRPIVSPANAICLQTSSRGLRAFDPPRLSQSICVDSALLENLTLAGVKDAVRLLVYLLATILIGASLAPLLFWGAQSLAAHDQLTFLARYDFETFFHRALLLAAVLLLWPLVRSLEVRQLDDLELSSNPQCRRDLVAGF